MKKFILSGAAALALMAVLVIHSCKKDVSDGIVEPITIVKPDSLIKYQYAGGTQQIQIQFTTDRPINNVTCKYQIDSSGNANFNYTYPDTLFAVRLDSPSSLLNNKYTWTGSYRVPDSLLPQTIVRFDVKMKASGNPSNSDTVREEKQFKLIVQ
ncbi:MAG: hypothetical protein JST90_03230 [Bacteroidetes bacterium]|nr:hypothetical protein [Bacteroidota bacterium]